MLGVSLTLSVHSPHAKHIPSPTGSVVTAYYHVILRPDWHAAAVHCMIWSFYGPTFVTLHTFRCCILQCHVEYYVHYMSCGRQQNAKTLSLRHQREAGDTASTWERDPWEPSRKEPLSTVRTSSSWIAVAHMNGKVAACSVWKVGENIQRMVLQACKFHSARRRQQQH